MRDFGFRVPDSKEAVCLAACLHSEPWGDLGVADDCGGVSGFGLRLAGGWIWGFRVSGCRCLTGLKRVP